MLRPSFTKQYHGWNADPNAPHPRIIVSNTDVLITFYVNPFQFSQFGPDDQGTIRFSDCCRYRLGATNDEGWHLGQCRYSKIAPAWGEFYEISGSDDRLIEPTDWQTLDAASNGSRHFLFYFRDDTFECIASDWEFEPEPGNALFQHFKKR